MNKKILVLFLGILLVGGLVLSVSARDFVIHNATNESQEYFIVNGTTGNTEALGNITTTNWFKGIFNWIIGSSSENYLSFNGTQLDFDEAQLNATIGSIGNVTGSGTTNYVPYWTSQSNLGDSGIYYNDTTGNVGIGTSSPETLLQVGGSSDGEPLGEILIGDADSTYSSEPRISATSVGGGSDLIVGAYSNDGDLFLRGSSSGTAASVTIEDAGGTDVAYFGTAGTYDGRVGIGTATPGTALEVQGNVTIEGGSKTRLYMGGTGGDDFGIGYSSGNPDHGIFYKEGSPDYVALSPGGGGTSSPDFKVDGNGDATLTGELNADGTGTHDFEGTVQVDSLTCESGTCFASTGLSDGGTIGFDWVDAEVADTLTIDSSSTVAGDAITDGTIDQSEIQDDILDFVDFQDTLDLDSATQINVGTGEEFNIDLDGTADFQVRDGTTVFADFQNDGDVALGNSNEIFVDTDVGSVGIGTSSPSSTLDVAGDLRVSNNEWISARDNAGTSYVNMFRVNSNDEIEVGGALNVGSLIFPEDGGLVTAMDMPVTSSSPAGTVHGYSFNMGGDGVMAVYSEATGTGGVENKRIGIGVSSPSAELDVAGSIEFSDELLPDGSTCSNGQILKKTGANNWDCATDANSGGDITGVTAGLGLTGGGSSGSVTLNVGAGSDIDVAADTVSIEPTLDTVSTINFAGTGTINLLDSIDATTANTIEAGIAHDDISGAGTVDTTGEVQSVSVGGDLTGTVGTAQIGSNTVGNTELSINYAGSSSQAGSATNALACSADGTCETTDITVSGGDITMTPAGPSAWIADTFAANTYKSYISFNAGTGSNDPGAILHETSGTETNEGVLHLMPSDDNSYGDYVSIHGTNDPDTLKLHADGTIEGASIASTQLTDGGTIGFDWVDAEVANDITAGNIDGFDSTQILLETTPLDASENLDTFTTTGLYHQNSNADAATGSNYPVSLAGSLQVVEDEGFVYQKYHVYGGNNDVWTRTYYSSSWDGWEKQWSSGNVVGSTGITASGSTITFDCSEVSGTGISCSGESILATLGTSISEGEIVQDTLDDSEIEDNSLTAGSLAANSVSDSELVDDIYVNSVKFFTGDDYVLRFWNDADTGIRQDDTNNQFDWYLNGVEKGSFDLDNGNLQIDGALNVDSTGSALDIEGDILMSEDDYIGISAAERIEFNGGSGLLEIQGADLDLNSNDITGVTKLDAGTIDPPYTIAGERYATFVPSMSGVKEEVTGSVTLTNNKYVIDFDEQPKGSDLWLFWQTIDEGENMENIQVILTAGFNGNVWYTKNAEENSLTIHGTGKGEVSYRFTGNRYDWKKWVDYKPNSEGHVIPALKGFR